MALKIFLSSKIRREQAKRVCCMPKNTLNITRTEFFFTLVIVHGFKIQM